MNNMVPLHIMPAASSHLLSGIIVHCTVLSFSFGQETGSAMH